MKARILICPLNWGIGHASRCIPIIRDLQSQGHEIILAADGTAYDFLKHECPHITLIPLPDLHIHYIHPSWKASWAITLQGLKILWNKYREHQLVKAIVEQYQINWIISDNRYGVYHAKIKNTIITHQLFPITPWFKSLINKSINRWINAFDECWVPDYENEKQSLSGALSHGDLSAFKQVKFIGPLSRFKKEENTNTVFEYENLAIISGVEPHRTAFEKKVIQKLRSIRGQHAIVLGKPAQNNSWQEGNFHFFGFADTPTLARLIMQSKHIICRSGYSTIMDLHALGRTATFIPTPGQTEQEYLARRCMKN